MNNSGLALFLGARGKRIDPRTVREIVYTALQALPTITDGVVVGIPDAEWGERVVACIVPADSDAPPTLETVRALVRDRLGAAKAPKELRLVTELPRTALGKVQRHLLAGISDHN